MQKQALIVIAIGVYLGIAIFVDRAIAVYIKHMGTSGLTASQLESLANFALFRKFLRGFHAVAVFCLIVWFVDFGRGVYRYQYDKNRPPQDNDDLTRRLSGKVQLPFQFGILTLLAAMAAVAIVCSAYRVSLEMR
jgi:hypothetical protein